jgi:rhodanese-related sulfurtransferase
MSPVGVCSFRCNVAPAGPRYAPGVADYTPQQVAELLAEGEIQLIDVRQSYEHDAGRIAGDRLIELMQLGAEVDSLDPARPVVFYCRSGARSAMAADALRGAGFDAHNMVGGLLAWEAAQLPLDPAGGYVAEH